MLALSVLGLHATLKMRKFMLNHCISLKVGCKTKNLCVGLGVGKVHIFVLENYNIVKVEYRKN